MHAIDDESTSKVPSYPTEKAGRAAGGHARARKMTKEQRSESAKKAAAKRWEPVQEAICGSADKPLRVGDVEIECYVLEDGTRVITQGSFLRAVGRSRTARRAGPDDNLPLIIQSQALRPYISDEMLQRSQPIPFLIDGKKRALGYSAEMLPDVCDAYLSARVAGTLPAQQQHIAAQAELLIRGLSRVGIIALVDEATGYQEMRTRDALAKILEQFIDKELQPYLTTFQPEFYQEMHRLRGLPYNTEAASRRPQYFGKLTSDIVYKRLAPGVLEELKRAQAKTPAGSPKHKLFQRLTQNIGYPKLREHLGSVTMLMKLSADWDDFMEKLDQFHPKVDTDSVIPGMPARKELQK